VRYIKAGFIVILIFWLGCTPPEPKGPDAGDIAENNRAVGLMGYFDYKGAHEVFQLLAEKHPSWFRVRINLAIATLNLQTEGSEDKAIAILAGVLAEQPNNLDAHYCSALLYLYKGDTATATTHFKTVSEGDPQDAHAAYYLGQCFARDGNHEAAREWYEKAISGDPYLRSAYYGLFQSCQRLGEKDAARAALADFQKLDGNPQAHQAEFKYRRMGPRAETKTSDLPNVTPAPVPQGPLFAEGKPLVTLPENVSWASNPEASITACDINGDQKMDLVVPSAILQGGKTLNAVFLARTEGFELDLTHPLADIDEVNAILWADMNNDGLVDVYLCRNGANMLLRQNEERAWINITETSGTGNGELNTVDGVWLDADHDGDLDLFLVNDNGPNELLNNNLDGTFRMLGAEQEIAGNGGPSRSIVTADFDNDRDVDLFIINQAPPHEMYLNDRLWQYGPGKGFDALLNSQIQAAVSGDVNGDGQTELYVLDMDGKPVCWQPKEDGTWKAEALTAPTGNDLAINDFNGDGLLQLVVSSNKGWQVSGSLLAGSAPVFEQKSVGSKAAVPIVFARNAERGPSVVEMLVDGSLQLFEPGSGRHSFAAFQFSGKEDKGASMRSNISGIGTRFAARNGSQWTSGAMFPNHSNPGQSLDLRVVGMNGAKALDYVAVYWSDGVFQTELSQKAGLNKITETQRQLSSCPVLFVWNGEKYEFVSDLLGVGGMGYAVGPGQYSTPRPWENFQLPDGVMKQENGQYRLMIAEPMEESCYLDSAVLAAYNLPPGWRMTLDERMGTGGPEPTGEPRFYREEVSPVWAGNERGETVTSAILDQDFKAAPIPDLDHRFIGILGSEHILTLRFNEPIDKGQPMLMMDGWVEYPYSQTNFAAWQAGVVCSPPTLEARSGNGQWQTVYKEFGYPAGMPRRMSVPLENLPKGADQLRLRTNQEIYWDRAAVAWAEPCPEVEKQLIPPQKAVLDTLGFALRTTGDQRLPQYDATRRAPLWDTRHQRGFYTEPGEMTELVTEADDALTIFGPGEAVTFTYAAPSHSIPEGWTRTFVLETVGWCKDMDLYTRDGETIEPLPNRGKPQEKRAELHQKYNTRFKSGY